MAEPALEIRMIRGKDDIHNLHERVAALEAQMQHVATKGWVLGCVAVGMGLAATITLAFIRIFPA